MVLHAACCKSVCVCARARPLFACVWDAVRFHVYEGSFVSRSCACGQVCVFVRMTACKCASEREGEEGDRERWGGGGEN